MLHKPCALLALTTALTTGCATEDPATRDTSQAVIGCDVFDDFDLGPAGIEELGGGIDTLGFDDFWNTGCEIGPELGGGGGGFGFCPSQTKSGTGAGVSESSEDGARASARAEAYESAKNQCGSWFYYPAFPSYCEGGYDTGFTVSDSCLRPYPELYPNYWSCSARATVTCSGYTWHGW